MDAWKEYLPILIPVILIQFALMVTAAVHVLRHDKYRFGNKIIWLIVVIIFGIIGPIVYFTVGKGEE